MYNLDTVKMLETARFHQQFLTDTTKVGRDALDALQRASGAATARLIPHTIS